MADTYPRNDPTLTKGGNQNAVRSSPGTQAAEDAVWGRQACLGAAAAHLDIVCIIKTLSPPDGKGSMVGCFRGVAQIVLKCFVSEAHIWGI